MFEGLWVKEVRWMWKYEEVKVHAKGGFQEWVGLACVLLLWLLLIMLLDCFLAFVAEVCRCGAVER